MQQYPRAHVLSSLAVALLAACGADQKILADVECPLVWTNPEFTTAAYWPETGDPRAGNRYASLTTIGTGDAPKEGALFLITGQV